MSGLFGKQKDTAKQSTPEFSSLRVSTSSYGRAIPIGFGQFRATSFAMDYDDFQAIPHTESQDVGGKGGGGSISNTTYTYRAALILGIVEGQIADVIAVWKNKNYYKNTAVVTQTREVQETYYVPNDAPHAITVANAASFASNVRVTAWGFVENGWGLFNTYTEGVAYTRSGGTYTFHPDYAGAPVVITYVYTSSVEVLSPLSQVGLTLFNGAKTQLPWSYMTTNHPSKAFAYRGIAYVAAGSYDLGTQADIPNTSYEVVSSVRYSASIVDANPKDVISELMLNPTYGGYFPFSKMGDLSDYSRYCIASGLFVSPYYVTQTMLAELLTKLAIITNSEIVFSDRKFKIIPYADTPVTGNGVTWTPNLVAAYELTDDQFLPSGDSHGPVRLLRKSPEEHYNRVQLKFYDRSREYNENVATSSDDADISKNGERPLPYMEAYEICDPNVAQVSADLIRKRQVNVNNQFMLSLPFRYCLLEPMDLLVITDSVLNLEEELVRVLEITESDRGDLDLLCEEVPIGTATGVLYPYTAPSGYLQNFNAPCQLVQTPLFFEAPLEEAGDTGLAIWCAVTGQAGDSLYGGYRVWVSSDGSNYQNIGRRVGGARYGTLRAAINSSQTTMQVRLAGKGGQLLPGTAADAQNRATLMYVENNGAGEFMSHQGSSLVATNQYDLSGIIRAQLRTPGGAADNNDNWARVDQTIFKGPPLPLDMIGRPLYFKFTAFNVYEGGEQALEDVAEYIYTIRGNIVSLPPDAPTGLGVVLEEFGARVNWTPSPEQDVRRYELRVGGTDWDTASVLFNGSASNFLWRVQVAGSYTLRLKAIDALGNYSTTASSATFNINAPSPTSVSYALDQADEILSWTAPSASFSIDSYEIRYGTAWIGSTFLTRTRALSFRRRVDYGGARRYWVAAVDAAGNIGTPASVDANIAVPGQVSAPRATVVDNNALLFWDPPLTGSLPIDRYEVRQGASFAGGTVVGSNGNSTFATVFEQQSGVYNYWVAAVDSANNIGAAVAITATINQPPDYVLRIDLNSTFNGTVTNMAREADSGGGFDLVGPVDSTETWAQHFSNRGWTTVQNQIDAGYPLYIQPSVASGSYEEIYDYGAVLAATTVTATLGYTIVAGSVTVACQIYYKLNIGDSWTAATAGATSVLISNFRYVRVVWTFTTSVGANTIRVTSFNLKLANKLRTDSGTGTITVAASGVVVNFNVAFIDADTPIVQPQGTTPLIPVVDFTDSPNPTSFTVYLYTTAGVLTTGSFSWQARGF